MAHGIIKGIDRVQGIEQAWHGLSEVSEKIEFEGSALDYVVTTEPVFDASGNQLADTQVDRNGNIVKFPYQHIVADCGTVLGLVRDSYQTIQNKELWDTVSVLIDEYGFKVTTLGSIFARKRVFATLEAPESEFSVGDDKHVLRLCFVSSHDGSLRAQFYNSDIRIVCANTLKFSIDALHRHGVDRRKQSVDPSANTFFSFAKHTKNAKTALSNIQSSLVNFYDERSILNNIFEEWSQQKVSQDDAKNIIAGVIGGNKKELATNSINQIEAIFDLSQNGRGNTGETLYDVFNGFTEFWTHGRETTSREKAFLSSEFGSYANNKEKLLHDFIDGKAESFAESGKKLLELV